MEVEWRVEETLRECGGWVVCVVGIAAEGYNERRKTRRGGGIRRAANSLSSTDREKARLHTAAAAAITTAHTAEQYRLCISPFSVFLSLSPSTLSVTVPHSRYTTTTK